ncbi:CPBP family intramembrane glutamic endopeptidase [Nonomuraea africana]|uniref:Membrane protease YdiL (CAAX protease family) n=1 Tax=Nonomuraea africana TaxID=46171 RepID=A0ABR9KM40_9ACTN|nr:CPBP family intramembrane glutamic endopeptidase [Nonomuraea africana]MBE1563091.1 membrane protease YdiL (CAAX protease family) [Nonomuraea africana]
MSLALFIALVVHLAVVSPLLGRRSYAALKDDPSRYTRMFLAWTAELWGMAVVALLVVGLSPEIDLADLGLTVPSDVSTLLGTITGLVVVSVVIALVMRRSGSPMPGQAAFEALIPRTNGQRWLALVLAVSAGVCEEIVFRGLLISMFTSMGAPRPVAAGLALAVFVAGHLYQGWRGMVMVTLAGFSLTMLYFTSGSLALPIVIHILIDIRSLLMARPAESPRPQTREVVGGGTV